MTADKQAVLSGNLSGFLSFPADFTQALMNGSATKLEVFADASATNTRMALASVAGAITSQINANMAVIKASSELLAKSGATPAEIQNAVQKIQETLFSGGAAGTAAAYLAFKTEKVGDVEAENPANWVIPGYLVMFVFMAAATSAPDIVKERKNNTLERLLSTSVKRESILGGIFTGIAAKGLVQIIIFWVARYTDISRGYGAFPAGGYHPLYPHGNHVFRLRFDAGNACQDDTQRYLAGGNYLALARPPGRVLVAVFPIPGMAAKYRQNYAPCLGDHRI